MLGGSQTLLMKSNEAKRVITLKGTVRRASRHPLPSQKSHHCFVLDSLNYITKSYENATGFFTCNVAIVSQCTLNLALITLQEACLTNIVLVQRREG